MQSRDRAPAVQGRCAQAAALSDALASLGRTPARMASLAAYGNRGLSRGSRGGWGGRGPGTVRAPRETSGFGSGKVWKGRSRLQRALAWSGGWMLRAVGSCLELGEGVFAERIGGVKTPKI